MINFVFCAPALALILGTAACSGAPEGAETNASTANAVTASVAPAQPEVSPAEPDAVRNASQGVSSPSVSTRVLSLEGLSDLRIGQPVPKGGSWAARGAQQSDACRTVTSPEYPGVYAIVSEGKVQRISAGKRSDVKLAEGLGVGSTEIEVRRSFAGFREEPHKYVDAPAKYLTAPNAASGGPALRFEIGRDGRIGLMHVGTMPVLAYVEGCG